MEAGATVSFPDPPPVVNGVVVTVAVQAAGKAPRWSLTLTVPSRPVRLAAGEFTEPRFTVLAGTVMLMPPATSVKVASVEPDVAALAVVVPSPTRASAAAATRTVAVFIRRIERSFWVGGRC